ncbi:hypothetical protein J7T55_001314 [Diaporthe amygdali]|uniref:uncharacterized protein n=1 Tax=Phomopsis amygdali TaxID=1214568 RepID=UPI0022FE2CF7|nr:uncharacterized protein J7T55_001314 [Diaporthe amygdali]KAJ0106790.1 hypothetical protein J7T55_001314 [Diaporthe amygdali]
MISNAVIRSEAEGGKGPTHEAGTINRRKPDVTTTSNSISRLSTIADIEAHLPSLRALLQSCVNPDPPTSSIGFIAPLSDAEADQYWRSLGTSLGITNHLFILTGPGDRDGGPEVTATVQLLRIPKATHAHRGEVAKLLVLPTHQRSGLGRTMMEHVEGYARDTLGLRVLTLDTETDTPARRFYSRTGWTEWGTCPDYAAYADGRPGSATFFVKSLV